MKKIIALVLCVLMVVAVLAACSDQAQEAADAGEATSDAAASSVEAIKEKGELVMLTNASFPPYEYLGDDNKPAGVDVDLMGQVAEELGVELKVVDMDFDGLIAALMAGKGDAVAAGLTVTDERKQSVDFSDDYATATQYIIAKEDDDSIQSVDDLADKVVGVQLGTTGDIYMSDDGMAKELKQYKNALEAAMDLKNGNIDAIVVDKMPASTIVDANEGLKLIGDAFGEEKYAVAVAKGNDDLIEVINKVIARLNDDGKIEKWTADHAEMFANIAG